MENQTNSNASEFFREQALLLFEEYKAGKITADQYMELLGMVYGDYLELHPEEHPYYEDRRRIERRVKQFLHPKEAIE